MTLRLNGTTSGYTEIDSAAIGNNNLLTLPTTSAGTLIAANSSGVLQMNSGYGSNANAYGCRAWVNFNGTGTVAIRASGNVSSITDNASGNYTVNFTTAMVDANYCVTTSGKLDSSYHGITTIGSQSSGSVTVYGMTGNTVNAYLGSQYKTDQQIVCVAIFR